MNKYIVSITMFLNVIFISAMAFADMPSVKFEYGAAKALAKPQSDRFSFGGSLSLKVTKELTPYLDAGVGLSFMALPSEIPGISAGTANGGGLTLKLKRPYMDSNINPWFDIDAQYVRTGSLDRFSYATALGVYAPLNEAKSMQLGPFVRYQDVVQLSKEGYNTTDAHVLIVGVSFEFGKAHETVKKQETLAVKSKEVNEEVVKELPREVSDKPMRSADSANKNRTLVLTEKVQFAVNSAVLTTQAKEVLKLVIENVKTNTTTSVDWHLRIEGHASSEGPPEPYNTNLSQRRAEAVLAYLNSFGFDKDKMTAIGYSSSIPVASNDTEAGRILNRRVEFTVNLSFTK